MIKKTFYNLPYEKRKRITDAVIKEFMERPNEKVSINRIIKTTSPLKRRTQKTYVSGSCFPFRKILSPSDDNAKKK